MASRREQVSALFFVAGTQRRLTGCFPWATEGPNPPKETLTFKKEFFWQTTSGSLPAGLKRYFTRENRVKNKPSARRKFIGNWQSLRSNACDRAGARNYTGSKWRPAILGSVHYGFVKHKNHENERTYSLRTHFGALRGRDGEEE